MQEAAALRNDVADEPHHLDELKWVRQPPKLPQSTPHSISAQMKLLSNAASLTGISPQAPQIVTPDGKLKKKGSLST